MECLEVEEDQAPDLVDSDDEEEVDREDESQKEAISVMGDESDEDMEKFGKPLKNRVKKRSGPKWEVQSSRSPAIS